MVEIEKSDTEQRHEAFTKLALKSAAELRKSLDPNSTSGSILYAPNIYKARDYVISGMLNEVDKAAISCMQTSNFILESQNEAPTKTDNKMEAELSNIERSIFESRIDETVLWERKMTEQLVNIVGFRHVKKDDYYRHYIVLGEIDKLTKISADFYQYHGARNKNIDHQLINLKAQADTVAARLQPEKCWYVNAISSNKKSKYEIANYKQRLDRVLPWMTPQQKLIIGKSYGEYSVQSGSLHPGQVKINDEEPSFKAMDKHFMRVTILATEVVLVARDAMNMRSKKGWLGGVSNAFKNNDYPKKMMVEFTKPNIEVGDFVVAYGDLAEVLRVNKSRFGYRSFQFKYLETPPIPTIPIDEMPAQYVQLYMKRKTIVEGVKEVLIKEGVRKPSTSSLNIAARKTVIEFWSTLGGREFAFGKREAGFKKMEEYLESQKESKS